MQSKRYARGLITLLLFWTVNSFTFLAAGVYAPEIFRIGSWYLTPAQAILVSGFVLAAAITLLEPVLEALKIHVIHDLSWALIFWLVNTEVIWLMGRAASYSGIGLRGFWVALGLGAIINHLQIAAWKIAKSVT